MVRITEELVRKKSEHNEKIISTLEELSLHQENIEKIEHLQNWCKDLKILLLQSNLITKIENLNKLKKLEYLNLAVNCIERIENLHQLESLSKLDLTLNFIGELTSVTNLIDNYNLQNLTLTGNPCTEFEGYRDYVISVLPQLETFDGIEVKLTDKLIAKNKFQEIRSKIIQQEAVYKIKRDEQKIRVKKEKEYFDKELQNLTDEEEKANLFWNMKSENCPETRFDIAEQEKRKSNKKTGDNEKIEKRIFKLFAECGRPYNINQARLKFHLIDEKEYYELELHVYRFLETSLIQVDAQPNYVRVTIKNKIFQMALNEEINISESTSKRSQITGHLVITMPKLHVAEGAVVYNKSIRIQNNCKTKSTNENSYLKGTVNYKSIVKPMMKDNNSNLPTTIRQECSDHEEIPDLI